MIRTAGTMQGNPLRIGGIFNSSVCEDMSVTVTRNWALGRGREKREMCRGGRLRSKTVSSTIWLMIVINLKTILFGSENDRAILETSRQTLSDKILDLFGKNKAEHGTTEQVPCWRPFAKSFI